MQGQKYGDQPVALVMYDQRWSYPRLALELGVTYRHLYTAARGVTTPSHLLRERLPGILGVPLEDLFTAESLAAEPHTTGPGNRKAMSA